ncbi:MAG: carbon-nitrogen hydrolase family protein [Clostridia bacterium]
MKIALIQMKVTVNNDENIKNATDKIKQATKNGAQMVVLPEMFCCPYETSCFPVYAQKEGGENFIAMSKVAKECGIYLVAGSMPENDNGKTFNTSYVFDKNGEKIAKHRKMHLFDISVEGGQHFMESETLSAGSEIVTFDTEFGKFGLQICFDIRFPELSRVMALEGVQAIIIPAAFNMTTGPAHWELLFRARALDNQIFMIGTSSARDMQSSYHSYANSIIASPWGDVLARLDEKEGTLYYDLDFEYNQNIRKQLPLLSARKTDVYNISRANEQ